MNNSDKSYITLKDLWVIFVDNIWLFVISIIICMSAAVWYIVRTPPLYTRTASVLVKDDSNSGGVNQEMFATLGLEGAKTNIDDEIHVFTTPRLMERVVERLSLDYVYKVKYRGLRWIDIYHSAPFMVLPDSVLSERAFSFKYRVSGDNGYRLSDFIVDGVALDEDIDGQFDQSIDTPYGSFSVLYMADPSVALSNDLYSFEKVDMRSMAEAYSSRLSATFRSQNASIIDLSITLGSKEKASDLVNTLIEVYGENWIKDRNAITVSTTQFIDERLSLISQELGEVDKDISDYKSENLLPDLGAVAGMNLQSSNDNFQRQLDLSNQLSMARYVAKYIKDDVSGDKLLPVNVGVGSVSIDAQIGEYNQLLMQKNALLANSSESNPIVGDMIANLNSMRSLLILSIDELITTLDLQIKSARAEELNAKARISSNPAQELYLLSSGREQSVKEQLYLYLLQKREESQLNQAFTAYNTKVLDWARGSNIPVSPQKNVILLLGFVIGSILPILLLIVRATLNTTVSGRDDLSGVSIPYLGAIPRAQSLNSGLFSRLSRSKRKRESERTIVIDSSRDVLSEAFRVVRTNLDFMTTSDRGCKLFTVTSFNPKSGKSFVALNIAISMALKSSRTLVIDCDLRRGSLSRAAHSPKAGLVNYLNGQTGSVDELICRDQHQPMLDVLPMGVMPPNPTELLLTGKFELMVDELKAQYDYIFFDCPPVEIVPDAMIVEKFSDATIFVIRAGLMDKRLIPEVEKMYTSNRLKSICIVLNDVVHIDSKYGYGRYGYGSYGDEN